MKITEAAALIVSGGDRAVCHAFIRPTSAAGPSRWSPAASLAGYQEPRVVVTPGSRAARSPGFLRQRRASTWPASRRRWIMPAARNTRALVIAPRRAHRVREILGRQLRSRHPWTSPGFTPALSALLLGAVMNDERSMNLDAPLSGYISAWADDPRGAITLAATASREPAASRALPAGPGPGRPPRDYALSADPRATLARLAARSGDAGGRVARGRERRHPRAGAGRAAWRQPFDKLLARARLAADRGGEFSLARGARAGCCMRARLGDWMRIGEVLANDGVFEGNQLTPPRFVGLMLEPTIKEFTRSDSFTHVGGAIRRARCRVAGSRRQTTSVGGAVTAPGDPARRR